jgi:hypothetical protein
MRTFKDFLTETNIIDSIYMPINLGYIDTNYFDIIKDECKNLKDDLYIYSPINRGKQQEVILFSLNSKKILSRLKYNYSNGYPIVKMVETIKDETKKGYALALYEFVLDKYKIIISDLNLTKESYGLWKKLGQKYKDHMFLVFNDKESAYKEGFAEEFVRVKQFEIINNSRFAIILNR